MNLLDNICTTQLDLSTRAIDDENKNHNANVLTQKSQIVHGRIKVHTLSKAQKVCEEASKGKLHNYI